MIQAPHPDRLPTPPWQGNVPARMRLPRTLRRPRTHACVVVVLAFCARGCTTATTGPSWVGGPMSQDAPERFERDESEIKERVRAILSEPKTIRARHILVMHDGSERKPATVPARTRDQAKARAAEALAKIRAGAKFEPLVAEYSDEPGAAERSGDLETFGKKTMVKAFEDVAFKLKIGEVSEVVETPFGFHVIMRTE